VNFKELCELAAEEVNGRQLTFSSVLLNSVTDEFQRKVIRQVAKAYADICLYSRHWRFLHKRGTLLSLRANVEEYSLPNVESIDWDSLYLTKTGSTARWPIYKGSYEIWKNRERSQNTANSIPLEIIRALDPDKWLFWPVPSIAYTLHGDLRWKFVELQTLTDEPIWDQEFHDLVAHLAARRLEGRVRTKDEIVATLNAGIELQQFQSKWDTFCARYLPQISGASTLL